MEVSSDVDSAIARAEKIDSEEPLLMENPRRFVMFPIKHGDIWQFYKKAEGTCFDFLNVDGLHSTCIGLIY